MSRHDSGLIVFKFDREHPAFDVSGNDLFYANYLYLWVYDFSTQTLQQGPSIGRGGGADAVGHGGRVDAVGHGGGVNGARGFRVNGGGFNLGAGDVNERAVGRGGGAIAVGRGGGANAVGRGGDGGENAVGRGGGVNGNVAARRPYRITYSLAEAAKHLSG
ncbi:unnamed protein product [Arabidopsis arenosa]|uniref:Uncharacterized protein n=1 Tax=Arabidopsis arenosa TaxID=38785 RepID=A0A8S2ASD8_ARAAE|nr:unnamed protein product [Arabidopsis arenosa]